MKYRVIAEYINPEQHAANNRRPLNLQLFADGDDGDAGDTGDGEESDGGDDKQDDQQDGGEKKYTEEQVNRMIAKRLARERREAERRKNEEAEAEKLKHMTEKERHDAEFEQMKKEIAAMRAEKNRADMTATAGDILREAGVPASSQLVSKLVSDTAEDTKKTVEDFVKMFNAAVDKRVKQVLRENGSSPKKGGNSGGDSWTREKIMAVKNPTERQRLIKDHMDLFS